MRKNIIAILLNFILFVSLNAAIVPGSKFSGKIEKINVKDNYVIVKKVKFYYDEKYQKILEKYYKSKIKIIFTYIKKNGKRFIIFIKKNKRKGGTM